MRTHQANPVKQNHKKHVVNHLLPFYTTDRGQIIPTRKPETITSIDGHTKYRMNLSGNIIKI